MKYDFDTVTSRRGTNSCKWDESADDRVLPMWVADMDFKTAPAIIEALQRRVEHGIFGYTHVPDAYYRAVSDWFERRHRWTIKKEWVIYTSGVVPAISAIIKALTTPGDRVVVQTPVYHCFFSSIRNNGCEIVSNPLIEEDHHYRMDYDGLEHLTADPKVKLLILCNPHNPACRVWTREELQRLGDICLRHGVTVIADEIHCELVMPGYAYTPFASLSEEIESHCVTCISPSKAFNIAGLQIANIVTADAEMRRKINKAININEVCDVNPFGIEATIAAYNDSEDWLLQLLDYLKDNYDYMKTYCREHLPQFPITELEGTYLVWMDCKALHLTSEALGENLLQKAHLWLNTGSMYGPDGEGFMRWNIACPRSVLQEGLERFAEYVKTR